MRKGSLCTRRKGTRSNQPFIKSLGATRRTHITRGPGQSTPDHLALGPPGDEMQVSLLGPGGGDLIGAGIVLAPGVTALTVEERI